MPNPTDNSNRRGKKRPADEEAGTASDKKKPKSGAGTGKGDSATAQKTEPFSDKRVGEMVEIRDVVLAANFYLAADLVFEGQAKIAEAHRGWQRSYALLRRFDELVDSSAWEEASWPWEIALGLDRLEYRSRLSNKFLVLNTSSSRMDLESLKRAGIDKPWEMNRDWEYADGFLEEYKGCRKGDLLAEVAGVADMEEEPYAAEDVSHIRHHMRLVQAADYIRKVDHIQLSRSDILGDWKRLLALKAVLKARKQNNAQGRYYGPEIEGEFFKGVSNKLKYLVMRFKQADNDAPGTAEEKRAEDCEMERDRQFKGVFAQEYKEKI